MPVGFQLIKSVVSSIQVYWSSVFILPKSVTQEIEKLMREFLWSHGDLKKGSAKVKWADVCCQKNYGGLGIKPLHTWNIALMSKHVWNIVSGKDSLWVKWVSAYRLKDRRTNRNFWDVPELNDVSWSWRKILQYRDLLRDHIIHRLGDGTLTSAWFDNWIFIGPLCKFISKRDIYEAGFSLTCKVADVIQNGVWKWPANWYVKFPFLAHLPLHFFLEIGRIRFYGNLKMVSWGVFLLRVFGMIFQKLEMLSLGIIWCGLVKIYQDNLSFFGLLLIKGLKLKIGYLSGKILAM